VAIYLVFVYTSEDEQRWFRDAWARAAFLP
jgi:hypothetical protein